MFLCGNLMAWVGMNAVLTRNPFPERSKAAEITVLENLLGMAAEGRHRALRQRLGGKRLGRGNSSRECNHGLGCSSLSFLQDTLRAP
jgi:hypothetical protein